MKVCCLTQTLCICPTKKHHRVNVTAKETDWRVEKPQNRGCRVGWRALTLVL
jgi:hypothetical protein